MSARRGTPPNAAPATPTASDGIELRVTLPIASLPAVVPDCFSQRNCELLGLTPRAFLDLLRRHDAPPVANIGKLRLVRRDAMLAYLERLALAQRESERSRQRDGADRVLLEMGCAPMRRT